MNVDSYGRDNYGSKWNHGSKGNCGEMVNYVSKGNYSSEDEQPERLVVGKIQPFLKANGQLVS